VFPFKRADEDPKRQFAGEGGPERTNRRFHYLTQNDPAKRLSTAFDSVTLYGDDPAERPDIYGKVGESGVSIATLADMKALYSGFDLCDPNTSVSMTINGPAPIILAFFLNAAIDQQVDAAEKIKGRTLNPEEFVQVRAETLKKVRGTVQADILKEDQAQNTCIFSTDFALKMMGDIQEYFIRHDVRNYYSVSISGYHIAEAGANPITQLAFTLANGFTYVEYYLSRGMKIDDFAPNLSFFFSNGMDPEYSVIGRVARRIWAIAIRDKYNGNERSQKLKYHIQTSGRSLHAQEIDFNDIRTTLQALLAINDNCNSLHTNAYDEAITTPTEESVRRSMAIQMIINREFGLAKNENPNQGSYFLSQLTDIVEEAVLAEFDRISSRGGVLGAMETQYQRGKIQEESLYYETLKHTGELPIIGVNTYLNPRQDEISANMNIELARASYEEKNARLTAIAGWRENNAPTAESAIASLKQCALRNGNIFEELLKTARVATLGQMTQALYSVGGQYRRAL
jgi:methylmalonyl-CoA mutase